MLSSASGEVRPIRAHLLGHRATRTRTSEKREGGEGLRLAAAPSGSARLSRTGLEVLTARPGTDPRQPLRASAGPVWLSALRFAEDADASLQPGDGPGKGQCPGRSLSDLLCCLR